MSNPLMNEKAAANAARAGWGAPDPSTRSTPITDGPVSAWSPKVMTVGGTATATGVLMVLLLATATIGWVMAAVGFGFFIYSIVGWFMHATLPGWASIMAAMGLLGGMQFLMLGIIGAYLGRLYDQSKGRPLFMIRDIVGGRK